jgi:photosystem II stability/assembly factor-like uncharacterized protein
MVISKRTKSIASLVAILSVCFMGYANPTLIPGVWSNIPLGFSYQSNAVPIDIQFDPSNRSTLYIMNPAENIWKSTNGGSTWAKLGNGQDANPYDSFTTFLDLAGPLAIDPNDSKHMYADEGVRGANNGFWVTTDGGQNWKRTFSGDFTGLCVDPTDFNHVLVGTHSCCEGIVYESKDGGRTFNSSKPGFGGGSFGLHFLYHPQSGTGDKNTWIAHADAVYRTTDAGAHWAKVSNLAGIHGNTEIYYTSNGTLYCGGGSAPIKSTDNGKTWSALSGLPGNVYYTIHGDGKNLYVCTEGSGFMTSPETDGNHWTACQGDKPARSALRMVYDEVNGIMYSANWDSGIFALKAPNTTVAGNLSNAASRRIGSSMGATIAISAAYRLELRKPAASRPGIVDVYHVDGKLMGRAK